MKLIWEGILCQVLLAKSAEVVQEAIQSLEKHGCHVNKELKSELLPSRKVRQVIVMRGCPPFVYMYIRPSQHETPRLRNSPVFSAGAHDNKTLYLATIGHETAQHSTSSLHPSFRLLLMSPIASVRATCLLEILPYWLTSFAPRGREHFHCSLG